MYTIGKIVMPISLDINEIEILSTERDMLYIPEELFFRDREAGIVRPNTLPLPDGVEKWMRARYQGENVHFARKEDTIYLLADTTIFGYCLFKLVSSPDNNNTFKVAYQGGNRIIVGNNERRQYTMAANLQEVSARYQTGVQNLNLGGNAPAMTPTSNEGISRNVDVRRLHSEITAHGYVAGYVMGNAPALSMYLQRKKAKDGTVTANIVAKENKPSRCLAVLMALPANCVQRNGMLATPTDIQAGLVDYTDGNSEMIYQAFPVSAAIGYITACGGRLPEYAPTVSGSNKQWSAEDILSEKPEVSFVYVHASENKSRNSRNHDQFRFSLKTTSGRRSLYTQGNIVCLRALEHTSVKCASDADVYRLNEIAFGAWRYRIKKSEVESALQRAMSACPSQIWNAKYEIDGKTVEGIGSAFFMSGASVKSESGENITQKPLTYFPWWQTGDLRSEVPSRVDRIVMRKLREASSDHKENMVTVPVLYREDPNNSLFRGYQKFADFITNTGFISKSKLFTLGTRASKSRAKSFSLTSEQQTSLQYFLQDAEAEIQAVRDEAATRAVLNDARAK